MCASIAHVPDKLQDPLRAVLTQAQDCLEHLVIEDEHEAPPRQVIQGAEGLDGRGDRRHELAVDAADQVLADAEREGDDGGVEAGVRRGIAAQVGRVEEGLDVGLRRADAARRVALFGGCVYISGSK